MRNPSIHNDTETRRRGDAAIPDSPRLPLSASPRLPRAFSLIEMLVVMAVAAILLGLVIAPLVTTFNFTNRARRSVEVQDAARYAMEVISRELADAMHVVVSNGDYFPFLFYAGNAPGKGTGYAVRSVGGITVYDNTGKSWDVPNGIIDVILPHDALGLEGGGVVHPLIPQYQTTNGEQHPVIVRYFIGLNHPDIRNAAGVPTWLNRNVVRRGAGRDNMYTLFRVEFDPYDAHFSNWAVPAKSGTVSPSGQPVYETNPDFYYDRTIVDGQPQWYWWRKKAVAVMPADSMDVVDFAAKTTGQAWNATSNPWVEARTLVSFTPLIMAADNAVATSNARQPGTYSTQYGHWTGLQNDGTVPYTDFNPLPGPGYLPRIIVYHQNTERDPTTGVPTATTLDKVFDTEESSNSAPDHPSKLTRVLAWNSLKGTVEFSLRAPQPFTVDSTTGTTTAYSPLTSLSGGGPPGAYISPGSEVVAVNEGTTADPNWVTYSRDLTRTVLNVPEEIAVQSGQPQQLPAPRTYIMVSNRDIIIGYPYPSEQNALQSQPVPSGHQIRVDYNYQNNDPNDVVKVDYQTRELVSINMTARLYDPVNLQPIQTTVTNRVRLRNVQR